MIEVHDLQHRPIFINSDHIRKIEKTPDTMVVFSDGQKMMVTEPAEDIVRAILEFKKLTSGEIILETPGRE